MILVGLVFFLTFILTTVASISVRYSMGRTVNSIEQNAIRQYSERLTAFYEEYQSWEGLPEYLNGILNGYDYRRIEFRNGRILLVFNQDNALVYGSDPAENGKKIEEFESYMTMIRQWRPIQADGEVVGHFWLNPNSFSGQNRFAQEIADSVFRAVVIGLILTCLIASLLGVWLARRFTLPLKGLMEGVGKVTKGDLSVRIAVQGKDELAMLGNAFNRMTGQLARNEEVRRNMVADIAHELRTPLSVIVGKLESIQEGILPSGPENLLPIQDETIRLIRLVRDLQQLSLAEAGQLPLSKNKMDIRKLLEKIFEQFEFELEERKIAREIRGEVCEIEADSDRLTQVFVNLIGNALLHTPQGGKISIHLAEVTEVKTEKDGQSQIKWLKIEVEDNGEGIPENELDSIFNRFYRVDKARGRESGGTGIGLAIAKEFVQAHGGSIAVESELGNGTKFIVLLPLEERSALY